MYELLFHDFNPINYQVCEDIIYIVRTNLEHVRDFYHKWVWGLPDIRIKPVRFFACVSYHIRRCTASTDIVLLFVQGAQTSRHVHPCRRQCNNPPRDPASICKRLMLMTIILQIRNIIKSNPNRHLLFTGPLEHLLVTLLHAPKVVGWISTLDKHPNLIWRTIVFIQCACG